MITQEYTESYLRINGISSTSTDENISFELARVGWKEEDVKQFISVLRNLPTENQSVSATGFLYNDSRMSPSAILSLLNIHIDHAVSPETTKNTTKNNTQNSMVKQSLLIIILGLMLAGATSTLAMYILKVGPFYT